MSLPVLWWRFRRDDRAALTGIAWSMLIVVLFVPAALPWYYSWPLAIAAPLAQSRRAMAAIAGFSTWVMVIFKPDGSHGMYSWLHFSLATAFALAAWYAPVSDHAQRAAEPTSTPDKQRLISHSLGAAHDFPSLVGVQRVDRTGVVDGITACRRG